MSERARAGDGDLTGAVNGRPGFWYGPLLSDTELARVQSFIRRQFLERIHELAPETLPVFSAAGPQRYHLHSHMIDHVAAWPRHARLLPRDAIDFLQQSSMIKKLTAAFGAAEITNEVENGAPEIVWRLVRPGHPDDVGPLHADGWFWDINGWPIPAKRKRIKVWTMVHGEVGRAGLRIVPGSHANKNWPYQVERRHGLAKPVFDEAASGLRPDLLSTPSGVSVVFDDGLLHGGAMTRGDQCRVSFEFTILVPDH